MTNPPNQGPPQGPHQGSQQGPGQSPNQWGSPGSQSSAPPPQPPGGGQYGQQPPGYGPPSGGPGQYGQQPYGQPGAGAGGGLPPQAGQTQFGGPDQPRKNNTPMLIGVGVIVLALIAGLIWFFTREDDTVTSTPATTTSQQSTDPAGTTAQTSEPESTEPETTQAESTEPESTAPETTTAQSTAATTAKNTGSVPKDPGKYKTVGSKAFTKVPASVGDYVNVAPDATGTLLVLYTHKGDKNKLVMASVLPFGSDGTESRSELVNPQVVGDFVCGEFEQDETDEPGSSCIIDISDGFVQFIASEDVATTAQLFKQWLSGAMA